MNAATASTPVDDLDITGEFKRHLDTLLESRLAADALTIRAGADGVLAVQLWCSANTDRVKMLDDHVANGFDIYVSRRRDSHTLARILIRSAVAS